MRIYHGEKVFCYMVISRLFVDEQVHQSLIFPEICQSQQKPVVTVHARPT